MAFKQTNNKVTAITHFINLWLKDQSFYCANCGEKWNAEYHIQESCCEHPQFGRNADHAMAVVKQNKDIRDTRLKETGANEDNTIRFGASMPPKLVADLESYFKKHDEKLFNTPAELHAFLKAFPAFKVCKKL